MADEIWSDLYHGVVADNQGGLSKVINIESVRTSIDNILGTAPGERFFLPEFASGLPNLLFEPMDDRMLGRVSSDIKEVIERWDNRVEVLGVDIQLDQDASYLEIALQFNVRSYTEVFSHTTTISQ